MPVSVATRPRSGGSEGGGRRVAGAPPGAATARSSRAGRAGSATCELTSKTPGGGRSSSRSRPDGDLVEDLVALVVDVLGDHVGELAGELVRPLAPRCSKSVRPEADDVDVGGQDAALAHDRALLVGLALQRLGDLRGVHLALEDAGERQAHHALEPSLEALQHTHSRSFCVSAGRPGAQR